MAVINLLRSLEGGGWKIIAYVNDVAIAFVWKLPQTQCDLVSEKLGVLSAWTEKKGLGANPTNTRK